MTTIGAADLSNMLGAADLNDPVDRRVMADALEDGGRYAEADLLRSLKDSQRVDVVFGEVVHVAIRVEMSDCVGSVQWAIDGEKSSVIGIDSFQWDLFNAKPGWWIGKRADQIEAAIRRIYHGEHGKNNHDSEFVLKVSLVPIAEAFRQ